MLCSYPLPQKAQILRIALRTILPVLLSFTLTGCGETPNQADLDRGFLDSAESNKDCEKIVDIGFRQTCLLKTAKPGTPCREIVGDDCKCGPFVITNNVGDLMKNTGYTIVHHEGVLDGCTDDKAKTQFATVKTTGYCRVQPLDRKCPENNATAPNR